MRFSPSPSSRVGNGSPGSGVTRGPGTFYPYIQPIPPQVARRFVEDMRAFFAEPNAIGRDEIAAREKTLVA
jgi:hypothetical protein